MIEVICRVLLFLNCFVYERHKSGWVLLTATKQVHVSLRKINSQRRESQTYLYGQEGPRRI